MAKPKLSVFIEKDIIEGWYRVWIDSSLHDNLSEVEGVAATHQGVPAYADRVTVVIDPRYEASEVLDEIAALVDEFALPSAYDELDSGNEP